MSVCGGQSLLACHTINNLQNTQIVCVRQSLLACHALNNLHRCFEKVNCVWLPVTSGVPHAIESSNCYIIIAVAICAQSLQSLNDVLCSTSALCSQLVTVIMAAGQQEDVLMVAAANLNAADVIMPAGNPPDSSLETRSSTVTADTHSNEWALAPDEAHGGSPEFVARVKAFLKQVIQEHGSPYYYLKFHLKLDPTSNEEKTQSLKLRNDYASWLWETFPESDQIAYHHNGLLPSCKESEMGSTLPLCIHVTSLGYDKACSAKEPPGEDVFTRLVDRYLIDGFVTASEPGWVVQPEALAHPGLDDLPRPGAGWTRGQLAVGSLGYIKFWGRVCSLHALLLWCKIKHINLAEEPIALQ